MGLATIDVYPPASVNAAPAKSSRGAGVGRHKAKKALEADLARLLLAAGVPRPIPGGAVRATAHLTMPKARRRDEGNYRGPLEKALGDALSPHPSAEELALGLEPQFKWLADDQPPAFTFGAVTFEHVPGRPPNARITLAWGEDLLELLERELDELRAALAQAGAERLDRDQGEAGVE